MQIHSIGIDLGKTTFHLVALGAAGGMLVKRKFTQKQLLAYTVHLQTSLIGLEACSGAHFLVRAMRKQGHDVRTVRTPQLPGTFAKLSSISLSSAGLPKIALQNRWFSGMWLS